MRCLLVILLLSGCGAAAADSDLPPEPWAPLATRGLLAAFAAPSGCRALAALPGGSCQVDTPWVKLLARSELSGATVSVKTRARSRLPKPWTARGWDPRLGRWRTWVEDVETGG